MKASLGYSSTEKLTQIRHLWHCEMRIRGQASGPESNSELTHKQTLNMQNAYSDIFCISLSLSLSHTQEKLIAGSKAKYGSTGVLTYARNLKEVGTDKNTISEKHYVLKRRHECNVPTSTFLRRFLRVVANVGKSLPCLCTGARVKEGDECF